MAEVTTSALGLACVLAIIAMTVAPGVLLAALLRDRWDTGQHGRRLLIAGVNATAASALLTVVSIALFAAGSMYDDRGAGLSAWPLFCCGFWVLAMPLSLVPLFVLRRPRDADNPSAAESNAAESSAAESSAAEPESVSRSARCAAAKIRRERCGSRGARSSSARSAGSELRR